MDYQVIVVGGSYAGLAAAMPLARARRRVAVIDAGRPRNRYAGHSHGFFGMDGWAPQDMLDQAVLQLSAYPTVDFIAAEAVQAQRDGNGFALTLSDGRRLSAQRLVLATGVRDELPPIPGLRERWGRSVVHCPYCHGYEFEQRPLGVLAVKATSMHQALLVPDWGPTTYFTQGQFEPTAEEAAQLAARGVRIEPSPVVEVLGEGDALSAVRLQDGREVELAGLFVAPTIHPSSALAEQLGCEYDDGPWGPLLRVDDTKRSSVPGVFAAGDASMAMASVATAVAAGMLAGVSAHRSLFMD
ncbi:NAD(P)/FAD-dependent oxidoreductase [Lysobacter silvisoli]|uniref:NAD(P)/FAD-dependent oxidoreductase n=1 Tax=Lysobacter silvisoli TaxID=2293254 RepID=A0A371K1S5_9GAMM|nr:NAD(P)/FAD-dependent oxidoreductase [Lysobacter silvisoli]RDZ27838.1 NAD(P)/FAD-dependent oxidoreductase [Lysobacter silvisoli]